MRPTRRLWATGALAAVFAVLAAVFARPLLLAATGLIGAWVLARQYLFITELERTNRVLSVSQVPARTSVRTDDDTPVTMSATLEEPLSLALAIDGGLPTAAVEDGTLHLSLEPGATETDRTIDVRWPVAGVHRFTRPTVTATDGLFRETIPTGEAPTVTVQPREPRSIHVGEGGDRTAVAYGEHDTGRLQSGLEPSEIREYVPGDRAPRIDWKSTARLGELHVREYEGETDRTTLLVVDHRHSLATGRPGETKLAYLREVAIAMAANANRLGDPLGLLTVGDDGITARFEPKLQPELYETIRRRLLELEPTQERAERHPEATVEATVSSVSEREGVAHTAGKAPQSPRTATGIRRSAAALANDDDPFAQTLRPFYADRQGYRERIESDPLYSAVQTSLRRQNERVLTVLCTDDANPIELRETVEMARTHDNDVLVFLSPTVLFESGTLADAEQTYERYVSFEELRRSLTRMERVTALEVAPEDRLAAVLAAGRGDRR
ncbi:DUF58 domain-containing protein [Natrialbaceae archaeon AArc-T1-2]|uniref:DUF58 domain-containing protein n=1 Tax=Natrialbaceae archaeon AArc-T1-2 TaxID=3053904 RepID=UPI00255B2293|nr:DUF58 domain-containing protein [Natrialbaceae archaeon AArc-T1-2]WIV68857.1 DUF58 domain-containing protein [Natrialbaceae archaeon AArc-T1-2]